MIARQRAHSNSFAAGCQHGFPLSQFKPQTGLFPAGHRSVGAGVPHLDLQRMGPGSDSGDLDPLNDFFANSRLPLCIASQ